MSNHAQLSPSGWDRWSVCPGSVAATADLPDNSSPYADEGTAAHWLLEHILKARYQVFGDIAQPAASMLGHPVNVANEGMEPRIVTIDAEMVEHVQDVLDYVERRRNEMAAVPRSNGAGPSPVLVLSERRVSPAWALETDSSDGTADCILVSDHEVEVVDLKYGRGVDVTPGTPEEPNGQLMLYLLGALGEWRLKAGQTGRITIAQPRAGGVKALGGLTVEAILAFRDRATAAIKAATADDAPRVASEKGCRWCKAKAALQDDGTVVVCRACAEFSAAAIGAPTTWDRGAFFQDVQDFTTRQPASLEPVEVVRVLQNADLFRGFLSALEDWAHDAMVKGTAPPEVQADFKLVHGRSQRRWMDANEASIASALLKIRWKDPATEKSTGLGKKEVYKEALKSPSQIEALLKAMARGGGVTSAHWDAFNRLVATPEGALQLVPITDDRPAAGPKDPNAMFGTEEVPPEAPAFPSPFALPLNPFEVTP